MKRKYELGIIVVIILFCLSWGPALAGSGEEDQSARLRQKINLLEQRVQHLEAMLKACSQEKSEEANPVGWQNKKNWRRLEPGMDMEKVQSLLGKPVKAINGVRTLWYYPNIYCGYVSFDKNGNLIGWNEP